MKNVNKIILSLTLILLSCFLVSCFGKKETAKWGTNNNYDQEKARNELSKKTMEEIYDFDNNFRGKKISVVYFSMTGNTKKVAETIANVFDTKPIEIVPKEKYKPEDITEDKNCRAYLERQFDPFADYEFTEEEMKDPNIITKLPEIQNINLGNSELVFVGYPIWFDEAPRVIYSFIKNAKLKNKTVVPFCTSDNSDISPSDQNLSNFADADVYFTVGKRLDVNVTEQEIKDWAVSFGVDLDIR